MRCALVFVLASGCTPEEPGEVRPLGGTCDDTTTCDQSACSDDCEVTCRTELAGGACLVEGCSGDLDCPPGTACTYVGVSDSYCLFLCDTDEDCAEGRTADAPVACDINANFVELHTEGGCVPPAR